VFVACPVVGIGEPESWPELAATEKSSKFFQEGCLSSEKLDESWGVVRDCESVMPGIPLNVVVGERIDPLFGWEGEEGTVGIPRIKEFGLVVPQGFVEGRSVQKVFLDRGLIGQGSHLTDPVVVETQLKGLAD
jgi:hypothetical protein